MVMLNEQEIAQVMEDIEDMECFTRPCALIAHLNALHKERDWAVWLEVDTQLWARYSPYNDSANWMLLNNHKIMQP
jgi:hypothetical protein